MKIATIHLISSQNSDDLIHFFSCPDGFIEVRYRPADFRTGKYYKFKLSPSGVSTYVTDLLRNLNYDTDPFEYLQLTPCTGPAIMYHIGDLTSVAVRHGIEDTFEGLVRTRVSVVLPDDE